MCSRLEHRPHFIYDIFMMLALLSACMCLQECMSSDEYRNGVTHIHVAVPLKRSAVSEIGLPRPPPLLTSSAHTFTVSPSPKVLLVVEFASWIVAPEIG